MVIFHPAMLVYQRADGQTCPPLSLEEFKRWGSLFGCFFFERKEDVEDIMSWRLFWGWIYIVFLPTFRGVCSDWPQVYLKKSEVFQTGTRHEGLDENIPTMGAARRFFMGFFGWNGLDLHKVLVTKSIGWNHWGTVEIMKEGTMVSFNFLWKMLGKSEH